MAPIEIPLNKSKLFFMLLGSLLFVAAGFWFVIDPPQISNSFWGDPSRLTIVGYASILFFGLCGYLFISKLGDNRPGLIINEEGIIDNSSGVSAGLIPSNNIQRIYTEEVMNQKFIMVEVNNPMDYISRQKNFLKRKTMQTNYKMYGTPITITANGLQMGFKEVEAVLRQSLQESKSFAYKQSRS